MLLAMLLDQDLGIGFERDPEDGIDDLARIGFRECLLEEPSGEPGPILSPVRRAPAFPTLVRRPFGPKLGVIVCVVQGRTRRDTRSLGR
jgi:hypothetical protein